MYKPYLLFSSSSKESNFYFLSTSSPCAKYRPAWVTPSQVGTLLLLLCTTQIPCCCCSCHVYSQPFCSYRIYASALLKLDARPFAWPSRLLVSQCTVPIVAVYISAPFSVLRVPYLLLSVPFFGTCYSSCSRSTCCLASTQPPSSHHRYSQEVAFACLHWQPTHRQNGLLHTMILQKHILHAYSLGRATQKCA